MTRASARMTARPCWTHAPIAHAHSAGSRARPKIRVKQRIERLRVAHLERVLGAETRPIASHCEHSTHAAGESIRSNT